MATLELLSKRGQAIAQEVSQLNSALAKHFELHSNISNKDSDRIQKFLSQKEKELYLLRADVTEQINLFRKECKEKLENLRPGFLDSLVGNSLITKQRKIESEFDGLIQPYQKMKLIIVNLLTQIEETKAEIQKFTLKYDDFPIEEKRLSRKIIFRDGLYSVEEIMSLSNKLVNSTPTDIDSIKDLRTVLSNELTSDHPDDLIQGTLVYSSEELSQITETIIALVQKEGQVSKENNDRSPQLNKWPTVTPLMLELWDLEDGLID